MPGISAITASDHPADGGCVQTPIERDEEDRLRRRAAVMRFLGHIRESGDERELMSLLVQAGAVWYDLDARAYRRELDGRFTLEAWLPGTDLTHDPEVLDLDAVLSADQPTRISSISETEQIGWPAVQGEVVLFPVSAAGVVSRCLAVASQVEREAEVMLTEVCRAAGAVLEQLVERRGREVRARIVRRTEEMEGSFQASVRSIASEYLAAVEAGAIRAAVMRPGQPTVTICAIGGAPGWAETMTPTLAPGEAEVSAERIALGFGHGKGAGGVVEFLASSERPFTVESVQAARAGLDVLGVWLAGISVGFARSSLERTVQPPAPPPFEAAMGEELERARRLSLTGGVLVASVPGVRGPDPRVLSVVIRTVREELRSVDLLGQLSGERSPRCW